MQPKHNILVIDDEEVVLDSCTAVLDGGDCRVTTANNGAEGLKRLEELQPDLIFLDLKMPGLSGLEVLEHLQRRAGASLRRLDRRRRRTRDALLGIRSPGGASGMVGA